MIKNILHTGVTVKNLDRSVEFYRDVVGLDYKGELFMEGEACERLFARKGCKARVAYLNGSDIIGAPPIELIQFIDNESKEEKADIFKPSISEICFMSTDIRADYERMKAAGVEFLSEPQEFDFTEYGFGKSIAVYFRDPDGIIMELTQEI